MRIEIRCPYCVRLNRCNIYFKDREDINFLFQYEFFAGSNIYFVYNYKDIQGDRENLFVTKIG